ncbi:cytochrome c oxidase subunit 6B1-like [Vespa mandarinia]|uniref:cytochrome c oxidase subunit 6B1-like n=1 Tax=Vespa mandarinia TaxID=7446 RepID=UPI001613FE9A|nr:cytochrome c oxidase subunit 6B1-like [Vespa mandarinia]
MVLENNKNDSNKNKDKIILSVKLIDNEKENVPSKPAKEKKKITIEVYEDDPCLQGKERYEDSKFEEEKFLSSPGSDPRFQQQNQTLRCYVMYTDFYRCEHILGEGHEACTWFKRVFTSICPNDWINNWDELRLSGKLPWHKYKTQGNFPGDTYGV